MESFSFVSQTCNREKGISNLILLRWNLTVQTYEVTQSGCHIKRGSLGLSIPSALGKYPSPSPLV